MLKPVGEWGRWLLVIILVAPTASDPMADVRAASIDDLNTHCWDTSDIPHHVSSSCSRRLEEHFASTAIWDGAVLQYAIGGRVRMHMATLSDRALHLRYTTADQKLNDLPVWSDIFDGRAWERMDTVERVFQDPVCNALSEGGGIQRQLKDRCAARELFKYAAYLDACMTGLDRTRFLHDPVMRDGMSRYQFAKQVTALAEGPTAKRDREVNGAQLTEMHLLATWIAARCRTMPARVFGGDLRPINRPDDPEYFGEVLDALKPVHDATMAIAARAGDEWAVQALYVRRQALDMDYWKSLHRFNPLLFHRWMATGIGAALHLTPEDRARHAYKAFAMEVSDSPNSEIATYLAEYGISPEHLDPVLRDGKATADVAEMDMNLVLPWQR